MIAANKGGIGMAYFSKKQDGFERGGKVVADIFCAFLILVFCLVFFGMLGGLLAFVVLDGAIIAVEYLMPNEVGASGAAIR